MNTDVKQIMVWHEKLFKNKNEIVVSLEIRETQKIIN